MGETIAIGKVGSISISIGRPLANVVSIVSSKSGKSSSLSHRVKSLGDWVKSTAGAKGDTSIGIREAITIGKVGSIGISIGRPLANVVSIVSSKSGKSSSLSHRVKSLGDWVKTTAGAKGDTS